MLIETIAAHAQPVRLRGHEHTLSELGQVYKQINAAFGELALGTLQVSTAALASNTSNDAMYTTLETKIAGWTVRRDGLAADMKAILDGATFQGEQFDELRARRLITEAGDLLGDVRRCAGDIPHCAN